MEREKQLEKFLEKNGYSMSDVSMLAGDASFRKYYRLKKGKTSLVIMDAPPPQEDVNPFINIANFLTSNGFSAPNIEASDIENGFLILEDLGDNKFNDVISDVEERLTSIDSKMIEEEMYKASIDLLVELHKIPPPNIRKYDDELLMNECLLLADWYYKLITGNEIEKKKRDKYISIWEKILSDTHMKEEVLVLRDYHADNLMWLEDREGTKKVGLLDFQDAVVGSPAYDLVSLLEDARRDVNENFADSMISYYVSSSGINKEKFILSYSILGAQRNCKILGIFARLLLRDGKNNYLSMMPRVWKYLEGDLRNHSLAPLKKWLDDVFLEEVRRKIPNG